jgi:tetratricopeptide (TPR) repeat protein
MARTVTISVVVSLLIVAAGCETADTSRANRLPPRTVYVPPAAPTTGATPGVVSSNDEVALVEQIVKFRQDYRQSLVLLVDHYTSAANNEKLKWAREELRALDRMPQYAYIMDPSVLPETLKATDRIPEADKMFQDALYTQRQAQPFGSRILPDEGLLRVALQKYYALIRTYPNSDKIDDAAWQSAGIYAYFKDYEKAIMFYKRTFQWDPATTYSARYEAARLLDDLGRRDEALPLYQEAVTKEARHPANAAVAERRIKELTTNPKP